MKIHNTNDLLNFLVSQAEARPNGWFGFFEQKVTGIQLAHEMALRFADKMSPEQIVDYVVELNNLIFKNIVRI